MNNTESLSKICKDLMLKEPYYGLFLIMTEKQWSTEVPTAGVCKHNIGYKLLINSDLTYLQTLKSISILMITVYLKELLN